MRYNPPPNWPKPPDGWSPPPGWTPDPSWPPPPKGWRLWVDDADVPEKTKSALNRIERSSDDVEYFGDDRAWSEASEQAPPHEQLRGGSPPSGQPTLVAPEDLSAEHLGYRATIRWADERRYVIGTIAAVNADPAAINVKLAECETPVSFAREVTDSGPANPRLYVWL
ncbi:hypothetical protein MSP7336_03371 [Mycobacterium shimoidei]|uniref:Uncharacterized protein n=1 Tax=Mycobacterium shimoidei TaxID=29313 RepID=A0A375Z202_MYCSH|nr:hypothetical protein [Mycobacterium shimoidei]SRX95107.1 hypothetical protein MSP7336_03371 [Mycobacterium shimoidei]